MALRMWLAAVMVGVTLGASVRAQPAKPRVTVDYITPAILNDSGMSTDEVDVIYTIQFIPEGASHAEVHILRDQDVLRRFSAPMAAGRNTVKLPAGLPLGSPSNFVEIQLQLPTGELSPAGSVRIHDLADLDARDARARGHFDRLEPTMITAQKTPQFVRIIGSNLRAHTAVDVGWRQMDAHLVNGALRWEVPPDLFAEPGFIMVKPIHPVNAWPVDPTQQLTLAVADPALPRPGGLTTVTIHGVDYKVVGPGSELLQIRGEGIGPGMEAVIGRGTTPITTLFLDGANPTTMVVSVPLVMVPPADDYFVAVLSADKKSLSRAFRIGSLEKMSVTAGKQPAPPTEPEWYRDRLRVRGDLAWNRASQWIYLEGPNPLVRPGLRVRLHRDDDAAFAETEADAAAAATLKWPVVRVPVPDLLTRKARYRIIVVLYNK